MCTNGRFITNKYTGHRFFVKCGHCEACLQEKANRRTQRIRTELNPDRIFLFITLTYDRFCHPYIRKEDVYNKVTELNIYRDVIVYRKRSGSFVRVPQSVVLDTIYNPSYDDLRHLQTLKHRSHQIGVLYYPDIQNFHKRLNINLKRKYNYYENYKTFNCSEYGESTQRGHFHCLLSIKKEDEQLFRHAITEAWPYASSVLTSRNIEVARNAASYVSSYVNCGSNFPSFLQDNFPPKHSFSKGFGMGLDSFQLPQILKKIDSGDLRYTRLARSGPEIVYLNLPVPKYVVNRYFPLFKGYSRIVPSQVLYNIFSTHSLRTYPCIDITDEDVHKIEVRLHNAYEHYFKDSLSYFDYCILYDKAWRVYRSTVYRHFMESDDIPDYEKYDNLFELYSPRPIHGSNFVVPNGVPLNPNEFRCNIRTTRNLSKLYRMKVKTKTVNNIVLSNLNESF